MKTGKSKADDDFYLALFFHNLDLLVSRKNRGVSKVPHFSGNLVCAGLK